MEIQKIIFVVTIFNFFTLHSFNVNMKMKPPLRKMFEKEHVERMLN